MCAFGEKFKCLFNWNTHERFMQSFIYMKEQFIFFIYLPYWFVLAIHYKYISRFSNIAIYLYYDCFIFFGEFTIWVTLIKLISLNLQTSTFYTFSNKRKTIVLKHFFNKSDSTIIFFRMNDNLLTFQLLQFKTNKKSLPNISFIKSS